MLISKTANWLLRHSVAYSVDEFVRMREITRSVKLALNVLLQPFLSTSIYRTELQKLSI